MSHQGCLPSHELVEALRHDALPPDVGAHAATCQKCGEIVHLATNLQAARQPSEPLPSFANLQWNIRARAILDDSRRRDRQATAPLRTFHLVAGLAILATALFMVIAPFVAPGSFRGLVSLGPMPVLIAAVMGTYLMAVGRESSGTGSV